MAQGFSTTRWSLVISAAGEGEAARAALTELCRLYWGAVYTFIRRRGPADHDASLDLTQEFFTRLLERNDLADVAQERGRFRSWLLTSVQNFVANQRDYRNAQKRDERRLVWIDADDADGWSKHGLVEQFDPEHAYHYSFTCALLQRSLAQLAEIYARKGKQQLFAVTSHLLVHRKGDAPDYTTPARILGVRPETLEVQVHRMRKDFRALVRAEVAELVELPQQVPAELSAMQTTLRPRTEPHVPTLRTASQA